MANVDRGAFQSIAARRGCKAVARPFDVAQDRLSLSKGEARRARQNR
jgi:hypothetical protein